MKRLLPFILILGLMSQGACKEKKQSADIITTKYIPKQPQAPIAMPADRQTTQVKWQGAMYAVTVDRMPADSLSMVKDESGQEYIDNQIEVTIARHDGSVFFRRMFTKASFVSYVDAPFPKSGILAGIRYDEVDDGKLEFAVVVALPDAVDDVFIPLEMTVDRQGVIQISRDDDMDMLDYQSDDDDSDEA